MIAMRTGVGCALTVLLAACASYLPERPYADADGPVYTYGQSPDPTVSVEPVRAIALAGSVAYAAGQYSGPAVNLGLAAAAVVAAYAIYDPLAPNWTIEETLVGTDTYRLSMRAKSFRTGGDGESGLILRRRALQLQRARGFRDYRIIDYSEGIESSTPFAHRFAEGMFQLVRAAPDGKP
ncbi:MAG: hypothetical protein H6942_11660 [Candidatus Accumulibacter sp.]|uniref:hypothetical protein n=1 Tax=Accumulibacter sp. TaxID=2053492 RepID=UPI001DCFD3E2|nr:hypothetical protein [Accumulibacter sp.]MCB1941495.1 hypothetical protein [Accumulibacter sp.]MCP5249168.1 hypothetical protein [Accumulibacter sp.]